MNYEIIIIIILSIYSITCSIIFYITNRIEDKNYKTTKEYNKLKEELTEYKKHCYYQRKEINKLNKKINNKNID